MIIFAIFKVPRVEGVKMVERFAKRYKFSEDARSQTLRFIENEDLTGEFYFEDKRCAVNIWMRENDFDITISVSEMMMDTNNIEE